MFSDYTLLVWKDFQQKKTANLLSMKMISASPANLRDLCLEVCQERFLRRDGKVLKEFFGEGNEQDAVYRAIRKTGIDKFRPLCNFLRNPSIKTEEKNVELLAWLIDFEPRPFKVGEVYVSDEINPPAIESEVRTDIGDEVRTAIGDGVTTDRSEDVRDIIEEDRQAPLPVKWRVMAIGIILTAFLVSGAYLFFSSPKGVEVVPEKAQGVLDIPVAGKCMYWSGEQFIPVSCTERLADTVPVIAFDSLKFNQLKRINRIDTITLKSIGYVWYLKRQKKLEYFTAAGFHPIHRSKLHPITEYIIRKYLSANL